MATTWDPVDIEKVAYHEAGHAVVAWLFGLPLKRIYLDLEAQGGGVDAVTANCLAQEIAVRYGGPASENMFRSPAVPRRAAFDRMMVTALLEKKGVSPDSPDAQGLHAKGYSWAEKLLRRHESKVARVAKRLLRPPHKMNPSRFKQLMREG